VTKTAIYKDILRRRKAAALGMTLEQFDQHVQKEQDRIDAIRRATYDRAWCWATIAAQAARRGRTFTQLNLEPT
jgi:hypothetical protein